MIEQEVDGPRYLTISTCDVHPLVLQLHSVCGLHQWLNNNNLFLLPFKKPHIKLSLNLDNLQSHITHFLTGNLTC